MDAGSLDKLLGAGVPEDVLGRIAGSVVRGLKFLKDELQIIHRGPSLSFFLNTNTHPSSRHQTNQRLGKPERPNQTLRFRRLRPTRKIPSKD